MLGFARLLSNSIVHAPTAKPPRFRNNPQTRKPRNHKRLRPYGVNELRGMVIAQGRNGVAADVIHADALRKRCTSNGVHSQTSPPVGARVSSIPRPSSVAYSVFWKLHYYSASNSFQPSSIQCSRVQEYTKDGRLQEESSLTSRGGWRTVLVPMMTLRKFGLAVGNLRRGLRPSLAQRQDLIFGSGP